MLKITSFISTETFFTVKSSCLSTFSKIFSVLNDFKIINIKKIYRIPLEKKEEVLKSVVAKMDIKI